MSQHKIQFKIQPGQLRAEEKTETKEAELGFFLVKPGEKLVTGDKGMHGERLKVKVANFTLKCCLTYSRTCKKKADGTIKLWLDRFGVWKNSYVSILLANVEEKVISQAFAEMAKKMSGDYASDDIPEIAVDLLHPDQQQTLPQETQTQDRAVFWIKDKEEIKRVEMVQDPDDIFFNVEGVAHVPHCRRIQVQVDGLTFQMRNSKHETNIYREREKKLWVAEFGWYSQGRAAADSEVANMRKNFTDEIIREVYMLMAEKLIEHEEKKRTGGKRKNVPPAGVEEWTLEGIEEEHLQKRVKGMEIGFDSSSQTP